MPLKLEYSVAKKLNVGDDLNPWLWPKLLGDILGESDECYFLGIGTILTKDRINNQLKNAKEIVIFSSGTWGQDSCPVLTENCKVYGVRGPSTARYLGLDDSFIIGDGAYSLTQVDYPKAEKIEGRVGFIPHHKSEDYLDWKPICESIGLEFISTRQPVEDFLIAIQQCESVISEAMHGAIISDALRIPWKAVSYSPLFDHEKWCDFSESMNINLEIYSLPFLTNKKFTFSKNISNFFKRNINKIFTINDKWNKNPILWNANTSYDLKLLTSDIVKIKNSNLWTLSYDVEIDRVINNQVEMLNKMLSDFRGGGYE